MTTTAIAPVYIEAPAVTPLPYGLLSTAVVIDHTDARFLLGSHYEPAACGAAYDSMGVCEDSHDFGDLSVAVATGRAATIDATGFPPGGTYTIDWGDGTVVSANTPDAATHTYAADGTYTIVVTDDSAGYLGTIPVTVATASTSTGTGEVGFSKVPTDGIPLISGSPFYLYNLFECMAPGSIDRGKQRAADALRLGEGRALERVMASLLAHDADVVDLTPGGGAVHPVDGLAALEQYAAANYGGVPVVHVPRGVGTVLTTLQAVIRGSGRLETVQGALVASGGGYASGFAPNTDAGDPLVPPDAGEAWLYVTGTVLVQRTTAIEVNPTLSLSPASNMFAALAERPESLSWECVAAAINVTTPYGEPV